MGRERGRGGRRRAALRSRTHTHSPGRAYKRTRARTRSLRHRHCVARPSRNGHRDWPSRRAAAVHTVPGRTNRDVRYVQRRRYDHLTSNTYHSGGPYYRRCSRSRLRLCFSALTTMSRYSFFFFVPRSLLSRLFWDTRYYNCRFSCGRNTTPPSLYPVPRTPPLLYDFSPISSYCRLVRRWIRCIRSRFTDISQYCRRPVTW